MIVVKPDPKSSAFRLGVIESISQKMATDIEGGINRYLEDPSRWKILPATVRTSLSKLLPAVPIVLLALPSALRYSVIENGFSAFADEASWATLDETIFRSYQNPRHRLCVMEAFRKQIAFCRNDSNAKSPCYLEVRGGHSDLSELYKISAEFLLAYKALIQRYDTTGQAKNSGLLLKHGTYPVFRALIEHEQSLHWLAGEGFNAFSNHPEIFDVLDKTSKQGVNHFLSLQTLLAVQNPGKWADKTVTIGENTATLNALFSQSAKLFSDVSMYGQFVNLNPPKTRLSTTIRDSLNSLQRGIPLIFSHLAVDDRQIVIERGFAGFIQDDFRLLKDVYQMQGVDIDFVTPIKDICDTLFPESKFNIKSSYPFQLTFDNKYAERPIYVDYSPIREISVALYDDLVLFLDEQKEGLEQKSLNMTTLYHYFTQFKAVLMLFRGEVESQFLDVLKEHGMQSFNLPGHRLQKFLYALLQNAARAGTVATLTAYGYKRSLHWFMNQWGFKLVDAYTITINKTDKHLRRLNTDDHYCAEECRELAFHLEALLLNEKIVGEYRLSLMLGKILLKTGWNLSPVLGIEREDIVRTATPLNPNGAIAIVLRKARAGYRSDVYTFGDPSTNVSAKRSAVVDVLEIRDQLTGELRDSLPEDNPYKSFIFIFEKNGVVQRLSMNATKLITQMLQSRGCDLTFDSKKIRKGGVNHLYRQVQKDLKTYEDAAKHDFKTFESSYYRIDENQARYTLGKAVEVMGKYFTGKEISSEIVIVTDLNARFQHTPSGECASQGNDGESKLYKLEHKRLHAERDINARFCADFLSCIWCKFFRLVADPEHVWKLLSYRDYLLGSMEASVLESDTTEDQQSQIDIFKGRVSKMLQRLDEMTPGVVQKAQSMFSAKGMHPDWSFAIADAPARLT